MFDLSLAETAIIFLIALIVLGPNEIPQIIKGARKLKKKITEVKTSVGKVFDDIENSANIKEQADEINKQASKIVDLEGNLQETYDLSDIIGDIEKDNKK